VAHKECEQLSKFRMKFIQLLLASVCLSGCTVALVEPQPEQSLSARYAVAVPSASEPLDIDWWSRIGDPQLNELLDISREFSPDLRSAAANVMAARARAGQTNAGRYPSVTGSASSTMSGGSDVSQSEDSAVLVDASWELDLFGKAAKSAKSDKSRAEAEEYTYAGAYISLEAEVADTYVQYRACRSIEDVYREALTSQHKTLTTTEDLVRVGFRPRSDMSLAQANLASSEIALQEQTASCRLIAVTLATVVGAAQDQVDTVLSDGGGLPETAPFKVSSIPSDTLRQRPDIAAAELNFSAALLDIDVAQADLYPSLTLGGSISLLDPTSWSFGPALSLPIFDAGQRAAAVRSANADALISAESYRSTVLNAVNEVEIALTRLDSALNNLENRDVLVEQYASYFSAIDEYWRAGGATLLDREEARRQLQTAQISQISQRETLLRQWIALYKAVGGGWTRTIVTETTSDGA
jgi:outer membrane protein, multidrug efflux system